jgi:transcriptional regulator with XRE-family HTH domain
MPKKPDLPPLELKNTTPIGKRIAQTREKIGLTQEELGKKIGIKRFMVSDYELGRVKLYDEMVVRFAIALGVSTDYLLGLKDKPEPLSKK